MPRAVLASLIVIALTASGCGGDKDSPTTAENEEPIGDCSGHLDQVTVSGATGAAPTVKFATPLSVDASVCEVLTEGDGPAATEGTSVIFHFLFVNGRDGKETGGSYAGGQPASVILDDQLLRGVRQGLLGSRAGARVVVAIAPDDGYGLRGGDATQGIEADDTVVFVADVLEVRSPLARAEGEAVKPPEGLPTVVLGADGAPAITVPPGQPPGELVVQPLIKGDGAVVEAGQIVTVHYTGVLYGTGAVFDSSWGRTPTEFEIGNGKVIPGWDKGLVGQRVGSQILLIIPPDDGYGAGGQAEAGIGGTDTLVFVVDLLDTRSP